MVRIKIIVLNLILCIILKINVIESVKLNDQAFIIGNLLPSDFKTESDLVFGKSSLLDSKHGSRNESSKFICHHKLSSVLNAIQFASAKLSDVFLDFYKCSFNLNPANTNVREFSTR